eukprot:m.7641 g.7641  ORF g.7641 m.7641 type:complete len:99 (-) comp5851_c0_seq1:254-550(-)
MNRGIVWTARRCLQTSRGLMNEMEDTLKNKITASLNPSQVKVTDQSGGCGTAFMIEVESEQFEGLRTIKQHKLVQSAIKEEIPSIHAITFRTSTPSSE